MAVFRVLVPSPLTLWLDGSYLGGSLSELKPKWTILLHIVKEFVYIGCIKILTFSLIPLNREIIAWFVLN